MADLPSASTTLDQQAGAKSTGDQLLTVIAPVKDNADCVPRLYSNANAILTKHGYAPGVDYAACHIELTQPKKPVQFIGVPIATAGVVGRFNTSGNTGSSVVSVAAGSGGSLEECDGIVVVDGTATVTVGTDQVKLLLSLDGGVSYKKVNLGTATSYTIPSVNQTVSFTVGTLKGGETVLEWHSTEPFWDAAGIEAAREALAAQQKLSRGWLIIGSTPDDDGANDVTDSVNLYETDNERFCGARVQLRDPLPEAALSQVRVRMTGSPTLTFAEVGATGDTITRSAGSWIDDGFAIGDTITVTGSVSNNVTGPIANISALVITLGTTDLAAEAGVANCSVVGTPTLTFAEVSGTGDTLTRSRGSWLDDGFRVGDLVRVTGSVSNNITATAGIATLTALVMTFGTTDLAAETIGSYGVSVSAGETFSECVAALDAEMADIAAEKRVNLCFGRLRMRSPLLGYRLRRPIAWHDALREYSHDVHKTTWHKAEGPLAWASFEDADGNNAEFDERIEGCALAARFTCARSWANGPVGPYIARSLTRAGDDTVLGDQHNMNVTNVFCTTVQARCEDFTGRDLELNDDGTMSAEDRTKLEELVNSDLERNLLSNVKGEGKRASKAVWRAAPDDDLSVPDATINGTGDLLLKGTVVHVNTKVRVNGGS